MTPDTVMSTFREAALVAMKLSAPILLISILIGLIIAIFQAATQIHEQTLTFVPKVFAIALMLLGTGQWMMATLTEFVERLFQIMAGL